MYLLPAIDRSTRWVEAVPLRNMEASTCTHMHLGEQLRWLLIGQRQQLV